MILPILYPSAIEYWMNSNQLKEINKFTFQNRSLLTMPDDYEFCPKVNRICYIASKLGLKYPVVLMAPSSEARRRNQYYICRQKPKMLPDNSFVCVLTFGKEAIVKKSLKEKSFRNMVPEKDINHACVASPELCFLQAAAELSFLDLLKLGYDLCAIYIKAEKEVYLQMKREPITCVSSIVSFLDTCKNITGIKAARLVARFLTDHSNSPMETKLCIIMVLPLSFGGFGIKKPELNKYVHLSKEAAAFIGVETICCDMVWEEQKMVVEYDSNLTHLTKEQHAKDKARATALQMSGYTVFTITNESLHPDKIENTMIHLKKLLGEKVRMKDLEKYHQKREETITYVLEKLD